MPLNGKGFPAAQRSAYEYARSIDLLSGADKIEAAHPAGRACVVAAKLALIHSEVTEALLAKTADTVGRYRHGGVRV